VVGGIIYYILASLHVNTFITGFGCMASVIIIRYLSIRYHWQLPRVKVKENNVDDNNNDDVDVDVDLNK
jgi:uncharacterized membrane protein YeiH